MRAFLFAALLLPTSAFAQIATPAAGEQNPLVSMLPLVFIFFVFYFLLIRPQQKRMKQHQEMVAAVKKGDEVITAGGILGKVVKLDDEHHVTVQIATGVEVKVVKSTLSSVGPKPEPTKPANQLKAERNDNSVPSKDSIANDN